MTVASPCRTALSYDTTTSKWRALLWTNEGWARLGDPVNLGFASADADQFGEVFAEKRRTKFSVGKQSFGSENNPVKVKPEGEDWQRWGSGIPTFEFNGTDTENDYHMHWQHEYYDWFMHFHSGDSQ
jgi:hypothetical protein